MTSFKRKRDYVYCDKCKSQFNEYDLPKTIPCANTICSECESTIICKEAGINKRFKCSLCTEFHDISALNCFVLNQQAIDNLFFNETTLIIRSQDYKQFELNLKEISRLTERLKNDVESECVNNLNEHCIEVKRQIQLASEEKIQKLNENKEQINKSNEELIEIVDVYEKTCIDEFLIKADTIKAKSFIDELSFKANKFLNEKQSYLKQINTNENKIKNYLSQSINLKSKLNKELNKLKNVIFNNNRII